MQKLKLSMDGNMKKSIFYNLLQFTDELICKYIGLNEAERARPLKVSFINGELRIKNATSYKRHIVDESWKCFRSSSLKSVKDTDLQKLGAAAGKAISENLVISFNQSELK